LPGKLFIQCRRSINLMWIQIDLRVNESRSELFDTVRRKPAGKLVGEIFGLVIGEAQSPRFRLLVFFLQKAFSPLPSPGMKNTKPRFSD
jgi:hypothetical protein